MPTVYKTPKEVHDFDILADLRRVIGRHERFRPIDEFGLKIDILIAYNDNGRDAVKHHGAAALAKIKVVGPEDRARGAGDVRIVVDGEKYYRRSENQRDAILCHELFHINVKTHKVVTKGPDGKDILVTRPDLDPYERPIVKLIPDDWTVTGFRQVAEWYGNDSAEVRSHRVIGELLSQAVLPFAATPKAAGPEPETTPLIEDAFAALLSVGHTEAQARAAIDAIDPARRAACRSVSDLVDLIYRQSMADPSPPADAPIADLDQFISDGLAEAEAKKGGEAPPSDPPPVIETDLEATLAAESDADDKRARFDRLPASALVLDDDISRAVAAQDIERLGQLDDFLMDADDLLSIGKTLGLGREPVIELCNEFFAFKDKFLGYGQDVPAWAGDRPKCERCRIECGFDPAPKPNHFDRFPRAKWTCPRCWRLEKTIEPPAPEPKPFVPDYEAIERDAKVDGPKPKRGRKTKAPEPLPGPAPANSPVTLAARLCALPVIPLKALALDPKLAAILASSRLGTLATLGQALAEAPDLETFAIKARTTQPEAQAIYHAVLDWIEAHAGEIDAAATVPGRVCNRCNAERPGTVEVCEECGCPEFRTSQVDAIEPKRPKGRRASKGAAAQAVANG